MLVHISGCQLTSSLAPLYTLLDKQNWKWCQQWLCDTTKDSPWILSSPDISFWTLFRGTWLLYGREHTQHFPSGVAKRTAGHLVNSVVCPEGTQSAQKPAWLSYTLTEWKHFTGKTACSSKRHNLSQHCGKSDWQKHSRVSSGSGLSYHGPPENL